MEAPEIKSDEKTLAIRATWTKRWVNDSSKKPTTGSVRLKDGVFTFSDIHGKPVFTTRIEDVKQVRGCLVALPRIASGLLEVSIRLVPKKKQKDLLIFSWVPGKFPANRAGKYKEWLRTFESLGVQTRNDTYWLNTLVILFYCVTFYFLLRVSHVL